MNMNVQEIFNKVIEHDLYDPASHLTYRSLMCLALDRAMASWNLITWEERARAKASIHEYMSDLNGLPDNYKSYPLPVGTLANALHKAGLASSPEDLMFIYKNWNMRPYPEHPEVYLPQGECNE